MSMWLVVDEGALDIPLQTTRLKLGLRFCIQPKLSMSPYISSWVAASAIRSKSTAGSGVTVHTTSLPPLKPAVLKASNALR